MPTTTTEPTLLDQLIERRAKLVDEWGTAIETRETARAAFEARQADADEAKRPTQEERDKYAADETAFGADSDQRDAEISDLDKRIKDQKKIQKRRKDAGDAAGDGNVRVGEEPLTYRRDNAHEYSYFRDLALISSPAAAARMTQHSATDAASRMMHHAKEMDVEVPKRAAARERRAIEQVEKAERRTLEQSPFEARVTPNRTDGQGGYFVPPVWWIDEYIKALRAGRVAAGLCRQMDLPEGTDSINIPKISTATLTGYQGQDNAPLPGQDFTDTAVTANIKTLGGQSDVAIQIIEMSPGQIVDTVIREDLIADYNRLVDRQVLNGNGVNSSALNGGQILGIYPSTNWSGTNAVTWTTTTPLGYKFNQVTGAMVSQIAQTRFDLSNVHIVVHPRRWFWFATSTDDLQRPLVDSPASGPWNAAALEESNAPAEGFVGNLPYGPRVYIDGNVTTTDSGGTGTQDVAIAAKWDDLWLFEGEPRFRVLPEVLSATLELRYQVYNYVAFLARYGQSIAIGSGTGFSAPAGADASVLF